MRSKIDLYRRLAQLTKESAVADFASELADRFGPVPLVVEHLLELARLRIWAHRWGVQEIRIEDRFAVLHYTSREKIQRLVKHSQNRLRVADGSSAYLPLAASCERRDGCVCRDQISIAAGGTGRVESAAFSRVLRFRWRDWCESAAADSPT